METRAISQNRYQAAEISDQLVVCWILFSSPPAITLPFLLTWAAKYHPWRTPLRPPQGNGRAFKQSDVALQKATRRYWWEEGSQAVEFQMIPAQMQSRLDCFHHVLLHQCFLTNYWPLHEKWPEFCWRGTCEGHLFQSFRVVVVFPSVCLWSCSLAPSSAPSGTAEFTYRWNILFGQWTTDLDVQLKRHLWCRQHLFSSVRLREWTCLIKASWLFVCLFEAMGSFRHKWHIKESSQEGEWEKEIVEQIE